MFVSIFAVLKLNLSTIAECCLDMGDVLAHSRMYSKPGGHRQYCQRQEISAGKATHDIGRFFSGFMKGYDCNIFSESAVLHEMEAELTL